MRSAKPYACSAKLCSMMAGADADAGAGGAADGGCIWCWWMTVEVVLMDDGHG